MGMVFEVDDRDHRTRLALKTLRHMDPRALLRFKNEFRALADLDHVNLVRLGELFHEGGHWFFTMELVDGVDFLSWVRGVTAAELAGSTAPDGPATDRAASARLSDTLDETGMTLDGRALLEAHARALEPRGVLDEPRLREALRQLAAGVEALHGIGKVHRDIKPSNVMVTERGRVVLLDFGLVTDARNDAKLNTDTNVVGTATYMSPEQAASQPVGPAADWYAVGAMLFEALTGVPPFAGPALEILMEKQRREPPPVRSLAPDAPADLADLAAALLRRNPEERPDAAEIARWLGVHRPSQPALLPGASLNPATPFVGRATELGALADAWATCVDAESHAVAVFLIGESGIGKSALARRFLADLEGQSPAPLVLASRCYEREALPYKAFDGLVDALARHLTHLPQVDAALLLPHDAGLLARLFPVLRRVPAMAHVLEPRVPNPQELRTRAFSALRELLTRLGERQSVAVFIDDFQWADADSLALLAHVMQGAYAPPMLFLATMRAEGARERLTAIGPLATDSREIVLGGLPPADARELVHLLSAGETDAQGDQADERIIADTAGHPLFVHELVRHVRAAGGGGPVRLEQALWARIQRLEPEARGLLEIIAVAGEPLPQPVAAMAAGLEPGDCSRLLGLLRAAHLVRSSGAHAGDAVECYHDRVREAATARLDESRTREHHAALAAALEASGAAAGSPLVLVRHLEAAGEPLRAAELAERAGARAAESLAVDRAAELYATALRLGRHEREEQRRLQMVLGEALTFAGRGVEAAEVFLAACEGADTTTRLECRRRAAEQLMGVGEISRGIEVLADVLAEFDEALPATPRRALLSLLWNRARLRVRGLGLKPREAGEIAPRDLAIIDMYRTVAVGLGMVDNVRGSSFQTRGLLHALRAGDIARASRALGLEACYLASRSRAGTERGLELAERSVALAKQLEDPFFKAWSEAIVGIVRYLRGEYRQAIPLIEAGERSMREATVATAWEMNTTSLFRCLALRQAGALPDLAKLCADRIPDAVRRGDRYTEATMRRAFAVVALARDAPEEALIELARCAWHPPPGGYHMQNWYEDRSRAEIDLYRGSVSDAETRGPTLEARLRRSLLWRVQNLRTECIWIDARMILRLIDDQGAVPKGALERVLRNAKRLEREQMGYTSVWAAFLRAVVAARRGDLIDAQEQLRIAEERAEVPPMRLAVAAARMRRGALMGGDQGKDLVQLGRGEMEALGVRAPGRFVVMLAPGYGRLIDA
jgi:serine/threonine protein kinase